MSGYVDLYFLPVPKKNLTAYQALARKFGKVIGDYGALEYREFAGDDLKSNGGLPFTKVIKLKAGEVIVSSIVGYKSKAHRDKVMKAVMADPRMKKMMAGPMLFDMKRMSYGGFKTIVKM